MVDAVTLSRLSALDGRAAIEGSRVAISPLPAFARFAMRMDEATAAESGTLAGFMIGGPMLRADIQGDRLAARLGPNEWHLIASEGEAGAIENEIRRAMGDRFHALVDIGHRSVALAVSGPEAVPVLNAGCPLDLDDEAFPVGAATRTILGKAEIVLIRTRSDRYHVECWRSFATYVFDFLRKAALDYGAPVVAS